MYFAIFTTDKHGQEALRIETRDAHLAYIRNPDAHPDVTVRHGGPTLSDDGESMIGSLIIIEAPSLDEARGFAANDPYTLAGLFAEAHVRPWKWATGRPEGS